MINEVVRGISAEQATAKSGFDLFKDRLIKHVLNIKEDVSNISI